MPQPTVRGEKDVEVEEEVRAYVTLRDGRRLMTEDGVDSIDISLRRSFPNQPFANPQYWAAFCAIGIKNSTQGTIENCSEIYFETAKS